MGDMVARDRPPQPRRAIWSELFRAWRAILSRAARHASAATRRGASTAAREMHGLANTVAAARAGTPSARERTALIAGLAAVVAAVGMAALLAAPESWGRAAANGIVAGAWIVGRLIAMRLVAGRHPDSGRLPVTQAWAAGALLHLIAVTPGLRALAWAGGAALTFRVLRSGETTAREAGAITAWGYGLEACGFLLVALARSVTVAAFVLGG